MLLATRTTARGDTSTFDECLPAYKLKTFEFAMRDDFGLLITQQDAVLLMRMALDFMLEALISQSDRH